LQLFLAEKKWSSVVLYGWEWVVLLAIAAKLFMSLLPRPERMKIVADASVCGMPSARPLPR
jgi:hypothetical protein